MTNQIERIGAAYQALREAANYTHNIRHIQEQLQGETTKRADFIRTAYDNGFKRYQIADILQIPPNQIDRALEITKPEQ